MTSFSSDAPPREGLPPCWSMIRFDGRLAIMVRNEPCGHDDPDLPCVSAGWESGTTATDLHPSIAAPHIDGDTLVIEATTAIEEAWQRAEAWVRTGELP